MHEDKDVEVEVAALFFEARMSVEIIAVGLGKVIARPEAAPVLGELKVLRNYADQAGETLEELRKQIYGALGIEGPVGHG